MENNKKSYWFVVYIIEPMVDPYFFLMGDTKKFLEFLVQRNVRSSFVEIQGDIFLFEEVKGYLKKLYGSRKKITIINFKLVSAGCFRKNSGNNP